MGFPSLSSQDGTTLGGLGPGKPLALLVYLGRSAGRPTRRAGRPALGDVAEANARNASGKRCIASEMHSRRSGASRPGARGVIASSTIWIDRNAFLDAIERNDWRQRSNSIAATSSTVSSWETVFDSWVESERVRLRLGSNRSTAGAEAALTAGRWVGSVAATCSGCRLLPRSTKAPRY